jgi:GcrA cell cycle regulator
VAAWTDEKVEKLRKLHLDGLSCSLIASRLGDVTRNSVIGKIHRLGIARGHQPTTRKPGGWSSEARRRLKVKLTSPAGKAAHAAAVIAGQRHQREANQAGPDLVIPPDQRRSILELTDEGGKDCRWPFGSGTKADPYYFCCHKASPGLRYCDFHAKRSAAPFQPPSTRVLPMLQMARVGPTVAALKEFDAMETA